MPLAYEINTRCWLAELSRNAGRRLTLAGVPEAQIFSCGLCTAMHLDVLTSYRAEGNAAGRIVAAIRPRPSRI